LKPVTEYEQIILHKAVLLNRTMSNGVTVQRVSINGSVSDTRRDRPMEFVKLATVLRLRLLYVLQFFCVTDIATAIKQLVTLNECSYTYAYHMCKRGRLSEGANVCDSLFGRRSIAYRGM